MPSEDALERLQALHDQVDKQAAGIAAVHGPRLHCELGCTDCCVDELTVFQVEAENIQRHDPALLNEGTPHPEGRCAFLDEAGSCRIYEHRPYVCRTQGLPLRWLDEDETGTISEYRDICPLNEEGKPLVQLPDQDCWTIGPVEEQLRSIQTGFSGRPASPDDRVSLRSLFHRKSL